MTGVRQMLSVLLAVAAIFSTLAWSDPSGACPAQPAASMAMHHHRMSQPAPAIPMNQRMDCAACLAVLPALATVDSAPLAPFALFEPPFQPLSGIDPALDPPPPRA